jgi:hypothetical protein
MERFYLLEAMERFYLLEALKFTNLIPFCS